jgi:hypothetical protein
VSPLRQLRTGACVADSANKISKRRRSGRCLQSCQRRLDDGSLIALIDHLQEELASPLSKPIFGGQWQVLEDPQGT